MRILGAMNESQTRAASRFMTSFTKFWSSGDKLRVFYPVGNVGEDPNSPIYDIIVSSLWGHNINIKAIPGLRRIFVPCMSRCLETGQVEESDYLCRVSGLSRLILKAQEAAEINRIANSPLGASAKNAAIEQKKSQFANAQPLVGPRTYVISTNCFVVKVDERNHPDVANARMCVQDLSDTRIQKLHGILTDSTFSPRVADGYLEVQYTMGSSGNRAQDGRTDPQGVGNDRSLATLFPKEWEQLQSAMKIGLPTSTDVIAGRDRNRVPVDEALLRKEVGDAIIINSTYLEEFDPVADMADIQRLARFKDVLDEMNIKISSYDLGEIAGESSEESSTKDEPAPTSQPLDGLGGASEASVDFGGDIPISDQDLADSLGI